MRWIVITSPSFFVGEAGFISRMIAYGVDIVHLRKPGAHANDCGSLLGELTAEERSHIVIHDFFELAEQYCLRGIHLNSRRKDIPEGYTGHVCRSCHSLEEVVQVKDKYDYVFLSPVFDSISKQGYASAFSDETLHKASAAGIIDGRVVALGGVVPDKIAYLHRLGFGGAAMLGCVNRLSELSVSEQIKALQSIRRMFTLCD